MTTKPLHCTALYTTHMEPMVLKVVEETQHDTRSRNTWNKLNKRDDLHPRGWIKERVFEGRCQNDREDDSFPFAPALHETIFHFSLFSFFLRIFFCPVSEGEKSRGGGSDGSCNIIFHCCCFVEGRLSATVPIKSGRHPTTLQLQFCDKLKFHSKNAPGFQDFGGFFLSYKCKNRKINWIVFKCLF